MKLKMIAAVLGLALAGVANAAPITDGQAGNSNLFFTVYDIGANAADTADDRAYVLNLSSLLNGGSLDNWATNAAVPALAANKQVTTPNPVYSVAADATLTSFLANTNDKSRLQWNVVGLDSAGYDRFLVTSNAPATMKNSVLHNAVGNGNVYLGQINSALTSSSSAILAGAAAYVGGWGSNDGGYINFSDAAGIGQSQNFYLLSKNGTNNNTQNRVDQYMVNATTAMTWTLQNDGTLVYAAAVPEPETYALFLAGLGMIGAIARRRLSK